MRTAAIDLDPIIREVVRDELSRFTERLVNRSEYLTIEQCGQEYALSRATLYKKIKSGDLALHRFGERSLLKRADVERLIIKCRPRPARYIPPKKNQSGQTAS